MSTHTQGDYVTVSESTSSASTSIDRCGVSTVKTIKKNFDVNQTVDSRSFTFSLTDNWVSG